jgi:hypothetical protein
MHTLPFNFDEPAGDATVPGGDDHPNPAADAADWPDPRQTDESRAVGDTGLYVVERGPQMADVGEGLAVLEAIEVDADLMQRAAEGANAIAFVHFDTPSTKSMMVEALVHTDDLTKIDRGLYVRIVSGKDGRQYSGRIVEGPFFDPDVLKRDSTPVQFIVMNQGRGKVLSLPEYHGRIQIELLGEDHNGILYGAVRRPHPASPVYAYDADKMAGMLHLAGDIILGRLDIYEDVLVRLDPSDKNVLPRNLLTVGTIGSGKSNTNQVIIEETVTAGYAQVVIDPEGEFIFMDRPAEDRGARSAMEDAEGGADDAEVSGIALALKPYDRAPKGVGAMTVYRPPRCTSKRRNAVEFSVPFDSLSPELIAEITDMNPVQTMRFGFLYEQAITVMRKEGLGARPALGNQEDADISRGYPGITLQRLIDMLEQEIEHYQSKPAKKAATPRGKQSQAAAVSDETPDGNGAEAEAEETFYCAIHKIKPLVENQADVSSYTALRNQLKGLRRTGIFDRRDAPALDMARLSEPGHLSVIDMSDCDDRQVRNIVIADLLARMYRYKMDRSEDENNRRKVMLTLEEAHGFISRDNKDKMEQTLAQLQRIARRGRKRWLALHFVTQSPQHLPAELFELANNKIIHQTTGTENLRVLKVAAGAINEGIWDDVPSLGVGRTVIVSSQYPYPIIARIRPAASRRNYLL